MPVVRCLSLLLIVSLGIFAEDAEVFMDQASRDKCQVKGSQEGLIRHWGYPVEKHDVVTSDDYVIDLYRIPRGRAENSSQCAGNRPVVLLMHGNFMSSSQFTLDLPEQSPGFVFADAGLDVFLGNVRGNTYGRRHRTLSLNDSKFWDFSWDEYASKDLPPTVDKILQLTGQKSLTYIGYSQGVRVGISMLASNPKYNRKIDKFFGLAPSGQAAPKSGFARILPYFYELLRPLVFAYRSIFGYNEQLSSNPSFFKNLASTLCAPPERHSACRRFVEAAVGPSNSTLNYTRSPVYAAHLPSGFSSKNLLHWVQMESSDSEQKFNYDNPVENLIRHGSLTPPQFNYKNVATPLYFFWSRNDRLGGKEATERMLKRFTKGIVKGIHEVPEFNHLDFALSLDLRRRVLDPILHILKKDHPNCIREA